MLSLNFTVVLGTNTREGGGKGAKGKRKRSGTKGVIDVSALISSTQSPSPEAIQASKRIYDAFSTSGFFQIVGHDVPLDLQTSLVQCIDQFFAQPKEDKVALHVKNGGVAWRGYMPLGGESTHGRTDRKEGMYFGLEHPSDHQHTGMPLHGKNQFPDAAIPTMRAIVLEYIDQIIRLGKIICDGISLSLGLDRDFVRNNYLQPEPVALFRCFKYPGSEREEDIYGIGEHSDFGLLTILKQTAPGLQVLSPQHEWVDVPVVNNAFVCSVGDMLDMMTGGRFKSSRHRVLSPAPNTTRLSFPFFFDYSWTAKIKPFPLSHLPPLFVSEEAENKARWATTTFTSVDGEWWQYLAKKGPCS
ncbi:hypothetical protein EW146_g9056 [Bondarzewia mesenterica]|uniref:Fe2OG dioxygenase domain-containing protein n=1 Tax=Bondarzewia mesenterica TaxID=1095465 RepID=A0A4S4L9A2_9AGAM|nr:hypothetical protein EW146_g9056 [Bondarzewia mesenterica]